MVSSKLIYNWYICMVAAMCMVLYGYDAAVFNAVQASNNWLAWFNLDTVRDAYIIALINTVYTIGAIIAGWFIGGPTADFLGRRPCMAIGCFLTIIATFLQAFAPQGNVGCFMGGRVLVGLGQGMALTAGPVYIGEVAPAQIRGYIMTFWQLFYSVGAFIAYWINYGGSIHKATLGEWDWRLVVIFQVMVPVIIISLLPFQPESPRWWIKRHGNIEKAKAALARIRDTEQEIEDEILAIREAIEFENEAISGSYLALFKDPSIRRRLWLAFAINIGQQLSGQGTLVNYSSSLYKKVFSSTDTINLINALNATFGIVFTLNAMWADRFGRRTLLIVGALGQAMCMLIVPIVAGATPSPGGVKSESVGISIVFLLFLFILFYKPSWGATVWIWTSEVFSMNVRAQAVGMCSQMQNVANTIFQQFFPIFLNNTGLNCLYFFFAINLVMAVFVYFFIPETKRVPLEEIDTLFGGQNHVEKGAQLMGVPDAHHANLADLQLEKAGGTHAETADRAEV